MSQFASTTDLAHLLKRALTTDESVAADLALTLVTDAIKTETDQQIEHVTNDVVTLQGNWTNKLELPEWPVLGVSAVTVNGAALAAGTWFLAAHTLWRGNLPIFNGPDDWGGDLFFSSWLGPGQAIVVTYSHGFATIPDVIRAVCIRAALRLVGNPEGLKSETVGTSRSDPDPDLLTDNEKQLLNRFRRWP